MTTEAGHFEIDVLGRTRIRVAGTTVVLPPAQRRVVSALALQRHRGRSVDELIDVLWGESPPPTARSALHVHLSGIRRSAPDLVDSSPNGYRLDGAARIDAEVFTRCAHEAMAAADLHRWDDVVVHADAARSLWRGDPFPDLIAHGNHVDVHADVHAASAHLRELRRHVVEVWARAMLDLDRPRSVVPALHDELERDPANEALTEVMMIALYRLGRQRDALRIYERTRGALRDLAGLEPSPHLRSIERAVLHQSPNLGSQPVRSGESVPAVATSFVGRDVELDRLSERIRDQRVLAVVGPAGVGTSRLAVELARRVADRFPDGVHVVEPRGAVTEEQVAAAIAAGIGIRGQVSSVESVAARSAPRRALLVLDGFDAAAEPIRRFCASVVAADARCRVVLTGRHSVPMAGVDIHRIGGLDEESACELLVDRIRDADDGFTIDAAVRASLQTLVRHLDGLPLAIELVAPWVPTIGTSDSERLLALVESNVDGFDRVYSWSVAMVTTVDRQVLEEASIFDGPFGLQHLAAVCPDLPGSVLAGAVVRLHASSLLALRRQPDGSMRYRMFGPVRTATRRSLTSDRSSASATRHLELMIGRARQAFAAATTRSQVEAFDEVDRDLADHRAALVHAVGRGDWRGVADVAVHLAPYWYGRFLAWEGRRWLDVIPDDDLPDPLPVLRARAYLAWATHDYDPADRWALQCRDLARTRHDVRAEADALSLLGTIHQKRRFADGAGHLDAAIDLYETLDDVDAPLGEACMFRGIDEAMNGSVERARDFLTRAVTLLDRSGHVRQISKSRRWLAHCAWRTGDRTAAESWADEARRLASTTGDAVALCGALIETAHVEMTWGDPTAAAAHLTAALERIPAEDQVDICQVLVPTARLAALTGAPTLAHRILRGIDDVYERFGWRPADECRAIRHVRGALAAAIAAEDGPPTGSWNEVLRDAAEHLRGVADGWSGELGHDAPELLQPPG